MRIKIPAKCELAYSLNSNCLYVRFFTQKEADDFYDSLPEHLRTEFDTIVSSSAYCVFVQCDKQNPSEIFDIPEENSKSFLVKNFNSLAPSRALEELKIKGWKYGCEEGHDFVLSVEGYRDYWLDFHEDIGLWLLKQFGMGPAICSFKSLGESEILSIFRLCSQYAKTW